MPDSLRSRVMDILLEQVSEPRYPSPQMMERFEANVTDRETAERYVSMLIDLLSEDQYPSPMLLERIIHLVKSLEVWDAIEA